MTAALATAAATPPSGPKGVGGPGSLAAAETPETAFGAVMAVLSAPTRAARQAAQSPTPAIADNTLGLGSADVMGLQDSEILDEVSEDLPTAPSDLAVAVAISPATATPEGAESAKAGADLTPRPSHAPANLRLAGLPAGLGAAAPQDLSETAQGQIATDPSDAPSLEAPRTAALNPAPVLRTNTDTTQPAPSAKAPQEPSPPVADLAAEAARPTADLSAQTPRPEAAPDQAASTLAAPVQVAGAQPRDGVASPRSDRAKANDEGRSSKDAAPIASGARPARSRGAASDSLAEAPPLPAASPDEHTTRDDTAAPDVLGSPETTATAQNAAIAGPLTHAVRGSPETVASLAAQIVKKLEGRSTRFDLELDPAGLGRVDVRIEIGARGHISAAMSFETPQAASELRARAGELRQALEQAGFDLSGGLSFDVAGDRGQARQDHQGAQQQASRGQAFQAALETAGDAADAAIHGALRLRRGLTSSLDLRI